MHRTGTTFILCAAALSLCAQSKKSLPEVSPTVKGTLVLPVPLGNPLFDDITETIGTVEGVLQLPLYKGLGAGAGGRMTWFGIKERALAPVVTSGDIRRGTAFAKVQFEEYAGPRSFYELSARVGTSVYTYDCSTCAQDSREQGLHWGITAGLYLHATDNLAFGLTIGYERDGARFNATDLGLEGFPGRRETSEARDYQYLTIGMGFSSRLRRVRERDPMDW
jgi:hypothetical protein